MYLTGRVNKTCWLIGLGGMAGKRVDSRMKPRFLLKQLVTFPKMEKTEGGIDFMGRMGRWWIIVAYVEFGILVV